jgi:hypothetical protein
VRRRSGRIAVAAGAVLGLVASLTGCAIGGPNRDDVADRTATAIRDADLGWTDVSASSRLDGFAHQLGVVLTQDASETELDPDRLKSTLQIIDKEAGSAGFSFLELGVYAGPQGTGSLVPVWPVAIDLGFDGQGSRQDTDFTVQMSAVHDVVG